MTPTMCVTQDIGHDPKNPITRVYATSLGQPWHTDASDIVGALPCSQIYRLSIVDIHSVQGYGTHVDGCDIVGALTCLSIRVVT